jgi:AhpD family alkylhydroperoxidase
MSHQARINFPEAAPLHFKALFNLATTVKKGALGERLTELVFLRVSQINGCGFCVDMHWRDLVRHGMEPRHINAVAAWREAPFFSERERAALRWAEILNAISHSDPNDAEFAEVKRHFSDAEIVELAYAVAVIRGWNILNISLRNPIPETPLPGL